MQKSSGGFFVLLTPGRGRRADPGLAPAGQDSRVVGAISLMFHDRRVALAKMRALRPPLPAASLDCSLWLAPRPPKGKEVARAAFLWYTAVHYKLRRCGPWPEMFSPEPIVPDSNIPGEPYGACSILLTSQAMAATRCSVLRMRLQTRHLCNPKFEGAA